MEDGIKVWTTVGSAGTLNQADLAKVTLHQSIVQLGTDLGGGGAAGTLAASQVAALGPTIQAIVRYNVTPVDGLFMTGRVIYALQIRYRGHITARLIEVDIEGGAEKQLLPFGNDGFPQANGFQLRQVNHELPVFTFTSKAYYVEATLITPQIVIGHPSAISVIQVVASPRLARAASR